MGEDEISNCRIELDLPVNFLPSAPFLRLQLLSFYRNLSNAKCVFFQVSCCYLPVACGLAMILKYDRAFSLLHQELPQIFGIMLPLVPFVKILKKNWGHRENLGESGGQTFKGSDREKCQF